MQRTEDEKGDNGKKTTGDREGPGLAFDDASSQETDSPSLDKDSSSHEDVTSPPATSPSATALVQDAKHSASGCTQQLKSVPETELAIGQDANVSKSILKKKLSLDLKPQTPSTMKLPLLSLEDENCPLMGLDPPPMLPMNIPSVAVDGTRCCLKSISTSEESLKTKDGKKVDNLDVTFSPGKRKASTSPYRNDSGDSESNPDRYENTEKQRQKKSGSKRTSSREKSPLRKKAENYSDDEDEMDKLPKGSRSKSDKSPTSAKKNKSPKGSQSKLEKSPTRLIGKMAKSPLKIASIVKGFFCKKDDEESKHLCETEDSGEGKDPPKKTTKGKPASKKDKGHDIRVVPDVNFSDTTCDSTSTKFSRASISTDSPTSDTANPSRASTSDRTPKSPIPEAKTSKSERDDDEKMEH